MKHIKLFEAFVSEGKSTSWNGKWKVEVWGKHPGAPEWELVDSKDGFEDGDKAAEWARTQKQGKDVSYDVLPEEGWIDPAGTWHPDTDEEDEDDFYDPASAYESRSSSTVNDSPFDKTPSTVEYQDEEGSIVEVKEIEGEGMAGEPMVFAYIFHRGKLSSLDKVKEYLSPKDFKELEEYINDISSSNEDSAISYVK